MLRDDRDVAVYVRIFKRFMDVVVASILLLVLLPVFVVLVAVVKVDSAGPVLFTQHRLGRGGRVFRLYKFRTMHHASRVVSNEIFAGHPEVTRSGKWLRRFKLDELPQLWNVLVGDMSVVGPRPAMPEQKHTLNEDGKRRLEVRPGLTGLAQVSGNIYLTWEERWQLDRKYVEQLCFRLDLLILMKTFAVVLLGEERFKVTP